MKLYGKNLMGQFEVEISDTELGKGGEGSVYAVMSHTSQSIPQPQSVIAKIYHDSGDTARAAKVARMIQQPPADLTGIAWPLALLMHQDGQFAGYLMDRLDKNNWREWLVFSNAKDRKTTAPQFTIQYALTASKNFLNTLKNVHTAGHRLGDINESNILVSGTANTTVIDTDSAQISSSGKTFFCTVAKPEYLAPELIGADLKNTERTEASDIFATAVMVFQVLANGHPTDGRYLGSDDPPSTITRNQRGIFPAIAEEGNPVLQQFAKLPRIQDVAIPKQLRAGLRAALSTNPAKRPSAAQLAGLFDQVIANIVQCSKVPQHWFDKRESEACIICKNADATGFDHWNPLHDPGQAALRKQSSQQSQLPAVSFNSAPAGSFTAPRAAPVNPSQQAAQNSAMQQAAQMIAGNAVQGSQGGFGGGNAQTPGQGLSGFYNSVQAQQAAIAAQILAEQEAEEKRAQEEAEARANLPKKYKGKMILDYADGTRDVRPPLGLLFKSNPKLAIHCFKEETPVVLQAWWSQSRMVAPILGVFAGFAIAAVISVLWFFLLPLLEAPLHALFAETFVSDAFITSFTQIFTWVSSGIALIASIALLLSALNDRRKAKKQYGSLEGLKHEKSLITVLRFIPIAIFYGPIFFFVLVFGLIAGLFAFIKAIGRA